MAVAMIPVSIGDLVDRLTILIIKREKVADAARRAPLDREHDALRCVAAELGVDLDAELSRQLLAINRDIWEAETAIRSRDRAGAFGDSFVRLARDIRHMNDARAALKKQIDLRHDSDFVTEKEYGDG